MRQSKSLTHKGSGRLRLQWPDGDGLVQGVARYNLPVVEHREAERLALRVRPQVSLEAKGVDGRHEGLDGVERRAWDRGVLSDVTSPSCQHCIDLSLIHISEPTRPY